MNSQEITVSSSVQLVLARVNNLQLASLINTVEIIICSMCVLLMTLLAGLSSIMAAFLLSPRLRYGALNDAAVYHSDCMFVRPSVCPIRIRYVAARYARVQLPSPCNASLQKFHTWRFI